MMYPLFLGSFGVLTIFVLVGFVVPKLTSVFLDFGQTLPLPTKILMTTSNFVGRWWWLIVIMVGLGVIIIRQQYHTAEGRFFIDRYKLKFPLLGKIMLHGELAGFSRTLSTLLESGVPVTRSLEVVAGIVKNEVLRREFGKVQTEISKGSSLGGSLAESEYIPLLMINMIKVGEKGGMVEKSLLKIADTYDREIDRLTRVFTTLLEPVLILTLGLVVGMIVVSMLLPIFNLNLTVQ